MRSKPDAVDGRLSGLGIRDTAANYDGDLAVVLRMVARLGGEAGLTPALERRLLELALGLRVGPVARGTAGGEHQEGGDRPAREAGPRGRCNGSTWPA